MGKNDVFISEELPKEKILNVRFLYIAIDSGLKVHYEFHNKGYIPLPLSWKELNITKLEKYLPEMLVRKCVSSKKNIIGVLQLWIYETRQYRYGRVRAIGLLPHFAGERVRALFRLLRAMDNFSRQYKLVFVETETKVIPANVMKRAGFLPSRPRRLIDRISPFVLRQKTYVKRYS